MGYPAQGKSILIMSFQPIHNKLKILIDPRYFADRSKIEEQVNFVDTLKSHLSKTNPVLCDVEFYYPTHIEERLRIRRIFKSHDKKIVCVGKPRTLIEFFGKDLASDPEASRAKNELISLAVEYKIPFILSRFEVTKKEGVDLIKRFNISILEILPLQKKIEAFLQGFYNYYKFNLPILGINSPNIAHAMSNPLHNRLCKLDDKIKVSSLSEKAKERVRSFVHNRYIDILVTIDRIIFYKVQQQISDMEIGILDNKEPNFHGSIRYYLNYYLLLLWGYVDHLCLIINDIFELGFNEETERWNIGLKNTNKNKRYLKKLKAVDGVLYDFVFSKEFQNWLNILGSLRHKNAHKEMVSPAPLLQSTDDSEISDEEIDAIIYKDKAPIDPEISHIYPPQLIEDKKQLDRYHYRVSKMEKILDHATIIEGGLLNPVARIAIDMDNLTKLTELFLESSVKSKFINN